MAPITTTIPTIANMISLIGGNSSRVSRTLLAQAPPPGRMAPNTTLIGDRRCYNSHVWNVQEQPLFEGTR